jgi:hypothetical protein
MKNHTLNIVMIFTLLFFGSIARAHGEDQPGPNGGYIRMPGAYHTEVVMTEPHRLKVYLLDIHWKNPVVKDSSVKITVAGRTAAATDCKASDDHFVCELPKKVNLNEKGTLSLNSTRSKQTGVAATYNLPLSIKPENGKAKPYVEPAKDEHHNHH